MPINASWATGTVDKFLPSSSRGADPLCISPQVLPTKVNVSSDEFKANAAEMDRLKTRLRDIVAETSKGVRQNVAQAITN